MNKQPNFLALSKHGSDQYIKMFARGSNGMVIDQDKFEYETMGGPIAFRGITKKKLIQKLKQFTMLHHKFGYGEKIELKRSKSL